MTTQSQLDTDFFARFTGCICAFCVDIVRVAHKFDCYLLPAAFHCYHCEPFTGKISEIVIPILRGGGLHGSLFNLVETSQIRTLQEIVNTANSAAFVGRPKVKKLCPWTPLGAPPPDPRYRLALPRSPWAPPLPNCFRRP